MKTKYYYHTFKVGGQKNQEGLRRAVYALVYWSAPNWTSPLSKPEGKD